MIKSKVKSNEVQQSMLTQFNTAEDLIRHVMNYDIAHATNKKTGKVDTTKLWQQHTTPFPVVRNMVELLPTENSKLKYLVLFNLEFVYILIHEYNVDPDNILYISDSRERSMYTQVILHCTVAELPDDGSRCFPYIEAYTLQKFHPKDDFMPKTNNLVVIGNPPYQEQATGAGTNSKSLYHVFVKNVIRNLRPRYHSFIIPSRWMLGGMGLDEFRAWMLGGAQSGPSDSNKHISKIVDFQSATSVFEAEIAGGVCYYLWDREHDGDAIYQTATMAGSAPVLSEGAVRRLDKYDVFVRSNVGVPILEKVKNVHTGRWMNEVVSTLRPYGIKGNALPVNKGIPCWFKQSVGKKFVSSKDVTNLRDDIAKHKVFASRAPIAGQTDFNKPIGFFTDGNAFIAKPGEVCSETYIVINSFESKDETEHFMTYFRSKFFRFLLSLRVVSQDVPRDRYAWVPDLGDYSEPMTRSSTSKQGSGN
jgi:site-specific DNA-methyltransferase (adenine-specific)